MHLEGTRVGLHSSEQLKAQRQVSLKLRLNSRQTGKV